MKKYRVVYMGSPDFSADLLEHIAKTQDVVLVYTNKDRPAHRGHRSVQTPVKEMAKKLGISILDEKPTADVIKSYDADVIIVFAYSTIISKEVLDAATNGAVNVHTSLLPAHRGASPIQSAILRGDPIGGVTLMKMDVGLDTGDIILQKEIILDEKTAGEVLEEMVDLSKDMVDEYFELLSRDEITYTPQDNTLATYCRKIQKREALINWDVSSQEIYRMIRAYNPWPVAYTMFGDTRLKIYQAIALDEKSGEMPGTVVCTDEKGIHVATGDNNILITEIQRPGKRRMPAEQFNRSGFLTIGDKLGG